MSENSDFKFLIDITNMALVKEDMTFPSINLDPDTLNNMLNNSDISLPPSYTP